MVRFGRSATLAAVAGCLALSSGAAAQTPAAGEADLAGLKQYMVDHAAKMKAGTERVRADAQQYYALAEAAGFDYDTLWRDHAAEVEPLLTDARAAWVEQAHGNYELNEGMIAGIPSLAYYDEWIDAGPSAAEDPDNALDVRVTLPDGRVLDKPGNLFHSLTEPILWGTEEQFVGARVDMDGDGQIALGEALPEANALRGAAEALDAAAGELQTAIAGWEPTLSDAFTALVVMIPTMSGYFEEWKLSPYVLGDASTQAGFVANSRLLDVLGILGGLDLTYAKVAPLLEQADPAMAAQIRGELDGLVRFVEDLETQEAAGTRFTPQQADQFGAELQDRATSLAGQIAQAAAVLGVDVQNG